MYKPIRINHSNAFDQYPWSVHTGTARNILATEMKIQKVYMKPIHYSYLEMNSEKFWQRF